MEIEFVGFDWDEGNIAKCSKHDVSRHDIENMFTGTASILVPDEKHSSLEERFILVGRTSEGRHLFVAFTTSPSPLAGRMPALLSGRSAPATCTGRR
jgi:uncharacterized DUF497 family protein